MGGSDSKVYSSDGYGEAEEIDLVLRVRSVKNKIPLVMFCGAAKISTLVVYDWLYEMLDLVVRERFGGGGKWQEMNKERQKVFINAGNLVVLMLDFPGGIVRSIS